MILVEPNPDLVANGWQRSSDPGSIILSSKDILNYRFLTTETNLKACYIFHNLISKAICSECTDFCLQLSFSEKGKQYTQNLSHFENKSTF